MIGIAGPFSGSRSAYGGLLRAAAEEAAMGHGAGPEEFVFLDDGADPAMARHAAEQFIAMGVSGVVGHFNSQCAQAVADLYHRARVPLRLPASTAACIPHEGEGYVTRMCGDNPGQCRAMLEWLAAKGVAEAGVFRDATPYAAELDDLLRRPPAGIRLTAWRPGEGPAPRGAVLLLGAHPDCLAALRILSAERYVGRVLACDDCSIGEYLAAAGRSGLAAFHADPDPGFAILTARAVSDLLRPGPPERAGVHSARGGWRIVESRPTHTHVEHGE